MTTDPYGDAGSATFGPGDTLALEWRWQRHRGSRVEPDRTAVLPDGLLPGEWLPPDAPLPLPVTPWACRPPKSPQGSPPCMPPKAALRCIPSPPVSA